MKSKNSINLFVEEYNQSFFFSFFSLQFVSDIHILLNCVPRYR